VTTVAILDYGMGNLRSAEKAFEHVGVEARITREHDEVPEGHGRRARARLRRPAARAA
jgi:imidazoleglycerol phosphate synthase glutamine amidotransferase subunit HisH